MDGTLGLAVEAALKTLPLEFQVILDLLFWAELSESEIGLELDLSVDEVVQLQEKALRALQGG